MEGIAGVLWGNLSNCTYLGIGNFFLWTIFSGRAHNMVRVQKWLLFFEPKVLVFGPQIRILPYDPNFRWWSVINPRHDGYHCTHPCGEEEEPGRGWDVNFSTYLRMLEWIFIIPGMQEEATLDLEHIDHCRPRLGQLWVGNLNPSEYCSLSRFQIQKPPPRLSTLGKEM